MLDLDSPRWGELQHVYGEASNVPGLLRKLEAEPRAWGHLVPRPQDPPAEALLLRALRCDPAERGFHFPEEAYTEYEAARHEPGSVLASLLIHQGDIYTASYAAVPHLVRIAEGVPADARRPFVSLAAEIEKSLRAGADPSLEPVFRSPEMPADLAEAYFAAVARLPALRRRASGPARG
jgi:hypothetical protein